MVPADMLRTLVSLMTHILKLLIQYVIGFMYDIIIYHRQNIVNSHFI